MISKSLGSYDLKINSGAIALAAREVGAAFMLYCVSCWFWKGGDGLARQLGIKETFNQQL